MFLTLLPYIAAALNLVVVLLLFATLNQTLGKLRNRVAHCETTVNAVPTQVAEEIKDVKLKLSGLEDLTAEQPASSGVVLGAGLNVTLRGKVLKMHRMGHSLERISDTLCVPKGEVDLLIKVHRIVMRPYEAPPDLVLPATAAQKTLNPARETAIREQA